MDDLDSETVMASTAPRASSNHPSTPGDTTEPVHAQQRRTSADNPADATVPGLLGESTVCPSPPGPLLTPFYTVISDATPSSHATDTYYPRVRYVFSDDDPDIISGALSPQTASLDRPREPGHGHPGSLPLSDSNSSNRSILLDLAPAVDGRGYTVAWASSLSSDWAVTGTRLHPFESVSGSGVMDDGGNRSEVLDIEGLSIPTAAASTFVVQDGRKAVPRGKDYDELVRTFEMRMALLRSAVQNSEERRRLTPAIEPHPEET